MFDVALKMLLADRRKLVAALVGVVFSVVLINIQGGLFLGLIRKASMLIDHADADIWVGHKKIHNVDFAKDIPRRWLQRIRGIPDVDAVVPYMVGYQLMTLPDGGYEMVTLVGVDPKTLIGNAWNIMEGDAAAIREPESAIVDINDEDKIGRIAIGDTREIGGVRTRIVAISDGILGFVVTPYVFTSLNDAANILKKPRESCSYFLVRTKKGCRPEQVRDEIRARLPDAAVYTRHEYARISNSFWIARTGIGISFGAATVLGLFVGLVVIGQALYASVIDRLNDYGTLLAIGANRKQLLSLLWIQATYLAFTGIVLGLVLAFLIQSLFSHARSPIVIPWYLSAGSCVLTFASCFVCATVPYIRVRNVDPTMIM